MRHPEDKEWSRYVDGDISARRKNRLERHLAECDHCRGLIGLYRGMGRSARNHPGEDWNAAAFKAEFLARNRSSEAARTSRVTLFPRVLPRVRLAGALAALTITVAITGFWVARVNYRSELSLQAQRWVASHHAIRLGELAPVLEVDMP